MWHYDTDYCKIIYFGGHELPWLSYKRHVHGPTFEPLHTVQLAKTTHDN